MSGWLLIGLLVLLSLDGARLHMMANNTLIDVKEYAALFDTIYLDCHKCRLRGTHLFQKALWYWVRL